MRSSLSRHRVAAALFAFALLAAVPDTRRPAQGNLLAASLRLPGRSGLSVMTYNIEGLPWPVRQGREDAFHQMVGRLRDLRRRGDQPHVALLQEVFADDARGIGAAAGYRYVVDGPNIDAPGGARVGDNRLFDAGRSFWKGERSGKLVGSGLQILSDYPVLAVRRAAFPKGACAGYDCLANKGMVMAVIDVPGPSPVAMVDVHLNSRHASGVSLGRSLYAYREQVDALAAFLRDNAPADIPVIVGGDFNIGHDPSRRAYVRSRLAAWLGSTQHNAFTQCLNDPDCRAAMPDDARRSLDHGRDWEFIRPGDRSNLTPRQITTPFGRDRSGAMLSDHIGYVVAYRRLAANT